MDEGSSATMLDMINAGASVEFVGFMVKDYKVYSMRFNLGEDQSIKEKEIEGNFLGNLEISRLFHCDGLLLCVPRDYDSRLVVWNPYLVQTKWIEPRAEFHGRDLYALGYDHQRNHKILRLLDTDLGGDSSLLDTDLGGDSPIFECELYDLRSGSWRVLDINPHWETDYFQRGVSLKGNSYFFARERLVLEDGEVDMPHSFLLCFDFTTESFGQPLPLPFEHYECDIGTLSCVGDEKLAALFQGLDSTFIEIWVTTRIAPTAASWSPFLKISVEPFPPSQVTSHFLFHLDGASFFIDEVNKTAVVFDLDAPDGWEYPPSHQTAFVIGQNGFLKLVHLGQPQQRDTFELGDFSLLVCPYDPSLAQLNQAT